MARTEKSADFIALAKTLTNVPWCDDYEKMISGMAFVPRCDLFLSADLFTHKTNSYDSFVPELVEGRLRARKLIKKYNDYLPDDATDESLNSDRDAMLRQFIGRVGKDVCIDPPFRVDYGCNVIIGDKFYANFKFVLPRSFSKP